MWFRCFLLIVTLMVGLPTAAPKAGEEPRVHIAGTIIPTILAVKEPGPYNEIYELLIEGYIPAPQLHMVPIRRANLMFFSGKMDCLYISSDELPFFVQGGLSPADLVISDVIHRIFVKVYTLEGAPVITAAEQLIGQNVAVDITVGEPSDVNQKFFDNRATLLPAETIEQTLALLAQGRVTAAIVYDIDMAIRRARFPEMPDFQADPGFSLEDEVDTMACRRNSRTEALIAHINQQLAALKSSGKLAAIFTEAVQ